MNEEKLDLAFECLKRINEVTGTLRVLHSEPLKIVDQVRLTFISLRIIPILLCPEATSLIERYYQIGNPKRWLCDLFWFLNCISEFKRICKKTY
jgi:hypothetical protein